MSNYTYQVQVKAIESKTVERTLEVEVTRMQYTDHKALAIAIANAMGIEFKTVTETSGHVEDKLGVIFKLGGYPATRFICKRISLNPRQAVEREIVGCVVQDALAAGYSCSVSDHYGESVDLHRSRNKGEIMAALFAIDEAALILRGTPEMERIARESMTGGTSRGVVYFVYGNDGNDVISDYTVNLQTLLTRANALAETL